MTYRTGIATQRVDVLVRGPRTFPHIGERGDASDFVTRWPLASSGWRNGMSMPTWAAALSRAARWLVVISSESTHQLRLAIKIRSAVVHTSACGPLLGCVSWVESRRGVMHDVGPSNCTVSKRHDVIHRIQLRTVACKAETKRREHSLVV